MVTNSNPFELNGFTIIDQILSESEIREISWHLKIVPFNKAGTRNLLSFNWCRELANTIKRNRSIAPLLPDNPVAVQCTYFEKSKDRNWLVALHRDQSVPVKSRINSSSWSAWSKKEGSLFAHPPKSVLEQITAVRLHLEDNTELNSPLKVIPGSHKSCETLGNSEICLIPEGGALIMRPLLLHGSSKLVSGRRRVLHFLFGPPTLPNQAEWAISV